MTIAVAREGMNPLGSPPSLEEHSPKSIREQLPLEWTIGHLWGLWGVGKTRVSCPSGDHGDSTPSFNLWAPDNTGQYTKFGCYGCGIRGDVLDAIQLYYHVGFHEAIDIAVDKLIPEFQKSSYVCGLETRPESSVEEMRVVYDELCSMGHDQAILTRFQNSKFMLTTGPYPHDEWRWRGHKSISGVSHPHYSPSDELFGVKFRDKLDLSKKWGIRGSKFSYLYGSWRDQGRENVVLCEGETDTVWAAWQLRDRNCDVMGIPTGAAQQPPYEAVAQLMGRKVWILFDGDPAGRRGASNWETRLAGAVIVDVPDGEDLMSCGISVPKLLGLKETK